MSKWAEITTKEVEKLLKDGKEIQLIDVREVEEYRSGHIRGAQLIPLGQLDVRLDEIDPNKETILVCRSGARSGRACDYLADHGYKKVKNMAGGMLDWQGKVLTMDGE
ncbi:rhodanese-like domain-containing protein [Hazenella coriacea]|uniref:Rhodanese-related sulfurtransferase n=1 Tax=Hazenella coriacea TaxID=1179467 RepID=A0A4R3L389_9BACL|nr:rhodanese-like domain-containing protein [Hazenella coriacea]TCS93969.1 rhodanese-related sulfurtransferase [Hazenella coriacea]